jgi:hypothetical protein
VSSAEERARLLSRLQRIAEKLPSGLLHRLVLDAQFFHDWNMRKKGARSSARLSQYKARIERADEAYWKRIKQGLS